MWLFLMLAGSLAGRWLYVEKVVQKKRHQSMKLPVVSSIDQASAAPEMEEATWQDILPVDTLGLRSRIPLDSIGR